jgi:hypothetical protein
MASPTVDKTGAAVVLLQSPYDLQSTTREGGRLGGAGPGAGAAGSVRGEHASSLQKRGWNGRLGGVGRGLPKAELDLLAGLVDCREMGAA